MFVNSIIWPTGLITVNETANDDNNGRIAKTSTDLEKPWEQHPKVLSICVHVHGAE